MARKLTHDEWINKYKDNIDDSLELLSKYDGTKNKIQVRCKFCGKIYYTLPSVLVNGCKCKHCSLTKTNEQFVEELSSINKNILPLEKYHSDGTPILVKCLICGHEWKAIPTHLLKNHGCPQCARKLVGLKKRKNLNDFLLDLKKKNPTIAYIDGFEKMHSKVTFKSKICGHTWKSTPNNVIYGGSGCPICSMSQGERKIYTFLSDNNIEFEPQKVFDDLFGVNNGLLSYDFYLEKYNLLIEYQGQQHEKPVVLPFVKRKKITPEEQFKIQQEHDKRKREYAKSHNIELMEIWYWDKDKINEILSNKLNINNIEKLA
jgi:hypothetical protein